MSVSLAICVNVVADVALLGFLGWMMSHPRRLTPHGPRQSPGEVDSGRPAGAIAVIDVVRDR